MLFASRGFATTGWCVQAQCARTQEAHVVEKLEDETDPGGCDPRHHRRHRTGYLGCHQA